MIYLNSSRNLFHFEMIVAEIGDMLVYTFENEGGRLAIDATNGFYSDLVSFKNDTLLGKLSDGFNYRFNVYISTGPIQKQFTAIYTKYYSLPGSYLITAWLNDVGPYKMYAQVTEGKFCFTKKSQIFRLYSAIPLSVT
jgi:hypothetical protein